MRKWMARMLALVLVLLCAAASAETKMETVDLTARDLELNRYTNTLAVRDEDGIYAVMNAAGEKLTDTPYLALRTKEAGFTCAVQEGVNIWGYVDGTGNELVPMAYGDIQVMSDRWQAGVALTEATAENYDYRTLFGDKEYFLVDTVDVFYCGTKVGTLTRSEWGSATAYGDYLSVRDLNGDYHFYSSAWELSPRTAEFSGEYDDDYKSKTVWHQGSGQAAFTPECTLTADQVQKTTWIKDKLIMDLQGNVLANLQDKVGTVYSETNGYVRVRSDNGLYGLYSVNGEQILACEYDEINASDNLFDTGYLYVVKDGKGGFVNLQGEATTAFAYSKDVMKDNTPFASLTNLDGTIIVLSAKAGELPEHYADVQMVSGYSNQGAQVFAAQNADGQAALIDLDGNQVIPFEGSPYDSTYDLTISYDGSVVLGSAGSREYHIYSLTYEAE